MPIDYSKYPPDWKIIRTRILTRAKNKCEFCGLKNSQKVYSIRYYTRHNGKLGFRRIWFRNKNDAKRECLGNTITPVNVILTVAHLDHDNTNPNVKDNRLKALCQICHLRYDALEKTRRISEKSNSSYLQNQTRSSQHRLIAKKTRPFIKR